MKKAKYIGIALVVALGLMGGAYAYWNDSLSIATAAETGTLKHQWFTKGHFPNKDNNPDNKPYLIAIPEWHDWVEGDTLSVTLENMYPGAEVVFYPEIHNVGTIPSKISGVVVKRTGGSQTLFKNIEVQYDAVHKDKDGKRLAVIEWGNSPYKDLTELEDDMKSRFVNLVLNPGDMIVFDKEDATNDGEDPGTIHFRLKDDGTVDNSTQDKDVTFTIQFLFEQAVR